ncbi:MAG: LptA/OstA family protein [Terracidiphilus sp.]|nr:LptA/OstA family protein [Terracidiphilus sp.]
MRLTIERMRTLVLAAGVLLVVALVAFLAIGKWKHPFNRRDLPKKLGLDIQQEANGWTYTHGQRGHTLYKIHASKLVQLTSGKGGRVLLHDVKIELYSVDGSRVDRIDGDEFEYDPEAETAKATGPVEITLMRPSVAPAIAPNATPQALGDKAKGKPLSAVAQTAASGQIHVKTIGLLFDQKSGVASTGQHVEFSMAQATGSAMGASYSSQQGLLVLNQSVELATQRSGEAVQLHAQHAEFERETLLCRLHAAIADYQGGQATAGEAKILFRTDGSAVRLDATSGFALATATGSRLNAPTGSLDFDDHNQPRHGHLEGGVQMDSATQSAKGHRQVHGTAPNAELEFTAKGELRHAHLERGVAIDSTESSSSPTGPMHISRNWRSPVADMEFHSAARGHLEPGTLRGSGGVVVTSNSQRGKEAPEPARMAADEVTGVFGPDSELSAMTGVGHAGIEQTTASGSRLTTSGDRLDAHFAAGQGAGTKNASQIQSATVEGHVVLVENPAAKMGEASAPLRATAGRAVYEGAGEWLHLTLSPRVEDGGLQLTADKIDVSQDSGDAFGHGNVKATWAENGADKTGRGKISNGLGGQGPAHAIAAEAQLHQTTGEATFRGHARLWQQANSITAPVIVLDRQKQTLVARSTNAAEPVRTVLVSAAGTESSKNAAGKPAVPSVIRVRGGDLKYSDAERKAVMHGSAAGSVVAETGTATSVSNEVELILLPPGNHAGKDGTAAQVDRMTARGRVTVSSQGRRGSGEQLVYSSESGEYVLTGTAAAPPRMTDPARGAVTGEALIFHSRDDSVSIEGGVHKTATETMAPR